MELYEKGTLSMHLSLEICVIKVMITTRHSQVVCKIDALKKLEKSQSLQEFVLYSFVKKTL